MFCTNCGKTIPSDLNYCSGCGSATDNVSHSGDTRAGRLMIVGGIVMGVAGIVSFFLVLGTILSASIDPGTKFAIAISYLAAIAVMSAFPMILGWKLVNSPSTSRKATNDIGQGYPAPTSLRGADSSQLPVGDPGFGSITEPTTRTLDEVLVTPKTNS